MVIKYKIFFKFSQDFITGLLNKPSVDIIINEVEGRKKFQIREKSGETINLPTFHDREDIRGKVILNLNKLKMQMICLNMLKRN